jgi:hypothetical protein
MWTALHPERGLQDRIASTCRRDRIHRKAATVPSGCSVFGRLTWRDPHRLAAIHHHPRRCDDRKRRKSAPGEQLWRDSARRPATHAYPCRGYPAAAYQNHPRRFQGTRTTVRLSFGRATGDVFVPRPPYRGVGAPRWGGGRREVMGHRARPLKCTWGRCTDPGARTPARAMPISTW